MGTTLENGVYLPSEGERNCYAGLKTNWEILDQKVADVTALQQAVAGALHRQIVASLPTTDIDPNTIYMVLSGTSATENVYNEFMYVNNAWELIGTSATDLTNYYTKAEVDGKLLLKANDSDVVHRTGNETASGNKTFSDDVSVKILTATGKYISDEGSASRRTVLKLLAGTRDKDGYSCSYVTRVRTNKAQGTLISSDVQTLGFDFVENQVRTLNTFIIRATNWLNDVPQKIELTSNISDYTYGSSSNKAKINDLEPSALGMPDLSNGIDISSYITHLDKVVNNYTPPANGWLSIRVKKTSLVHASLMIYQTGGLLSSCETDEFNISGTNLPVIANKNVEIYIYADSLASAIFYPCQGNV